jgi:hypothetical protein
MFLRCRATEAPREPETEPKTGSGEEQAGLALDEQRLTVMLW